MNWANVFLIFRREVRDQLRDRRTLFTVVVLPLLLYPLLGTAFLQMTQFLRVHPTKVLVLGAENLPTEPALLADSRFSPDVIDEDQSDLLTVEVSPKAEEEPLEIVRARVEKEMQKGSYDAAVYFPRGFADQMDRFRQQARSTTPSEAADTKPIVDPVVFTNTAVEKSKLAAIRIDAVLSRWREQMVRVNLAKQKLPAATTRPFVVRENDVAEPERKQAAVWSKILPFILLVWALTGAFYPAVDLCAGEKERGTLETLLCSPALRSEIVWGKLFTVMAFSIATSLLNLFSLGGTAMLVTNQLSSFQGMPAGLGAPPLASLAWLVLALPPVAALFGALAIAIASFARSTKEGQYYLLPLLMITFPLMALPMLPSAQLDLGTSLIPVTGLMLLLRSLMEGQIWESLRYAIPVVAVTSVCCLMAIRWAIDQFNRESVLFRESEQWGLGLWLRHLIRDRDDTPNFAESMLCAILLLVITFFAQFYATSPRDWEATRTMLLVYQIAFFATPPMLMAIVLTRNPLKTLLLKRPSFLMTCPAAILLAALMHPAMMWLGSLVSTLYPLSPQMEGTLKPFFAMVHDAPLWQVIATMALLPAICEELAFRGFILSGFRHIGHKWTAIVLASAFFGVTHGILQQSIMTFLAGILIGYIAVKTGSLLPAILYHFTNNSLSMITSRISDEVLVTNPWLYLVYESSAEGSVAYSPWFAIIATLFGGAVLLWYKSLPYEATREEKLQHALDRQTEQLATT